MTTDTRYVTLTVHEVTSVSFIEFLSFNDFIFDLLRLRFTRCLFALMSICPSAHCMWCWLAAAAWTVVAD